MSALPPILPEYIVRACVPLFGTGDAESEAIAAIVWAIDSIEFDKKGLRKLSPDEKQRVTQYLAARYSIKADEK